MSKDNLKSEEYFEKWEIDDETFLQEIKQAMEHELDNRENITEDVLKSICESSGDFFHSRIVGPPIETPTLIQEQFKVENEILDIEASVETSDIDEDARNNVCKDLDKQTLKLIENIATLNSQYSSDILPWITNCDRKMIETNLNFDQIFSNLDDITNILQNIHSGKNHLDKILKNNDSAAAYQKKDFLYGIQVEKLIQLKGNNPNQP